MLFIEQALLPENYGRHAGLALGFSLALHVFLLFGLIIAPSPLPEAIEVSLRDETGGRDFSSQPPVELPPQIVSPSAAESGPPPPETRFRSERDSVADHQRVLRGLGAADGPGEPQGEQAEVSTPRERPLPNARLRLEPRELAQNFAAPGGGTAAPNPRVRPLTPDAAAELSDDERAVKLEEYRPFQPSASGSMYSDRGGAPSGLGALGRGGVPDYLPDIPDGEITLLNAKADRHAVFVRRVALQVFGALRKLNWAEVAHSEARRLRGFVTVHATMSGEGKLLDATIEQTSGTSVFDRVVLEAASRGSWDQNPPGGARGADGNIHFIFKSRTWARLGGDGQREQRWLLLATGLL